MKFQMAASEFAQRRMRNILGLLFSILLVGIIAGQSFRYPEQYNDVLLWSVVIFVIFANSINYYRYRRYQKRARQHTLELLEESMRFTTGAEASDLSFQDVVAMNLYKRRGGLSHIQLKLKNGRGIRLEGYDDMKTLADELKVRCSQIGGL